MDLRALLADPAADGHDEMLEWLGLDSTDEFDPAAFDVDATVAGLLFVHTRETEAGITFAAETGFLLARDPDTVRAPDAAFVASERAEAVGRTERYWPGAPDFVAEVLSPGDTFAEVEAKALDWLAAGTKLVLVIDPARRTATTYRGPEDVQVATGDAILDLRDAVPGWRVALGDFFA
jgi:Uma2 family endonuclease